LHDLAVQKKSRHRSRALRDNRAGEGRVAVRRARLVAQHGGFDAGEQCIQVGGLADNLQGVGRADEVFESVFVRRRKGNRCDGG
jgi:hypothetical protein